MRCLILHRSRERLRVHVCGGRMTSSRADELNAYLSGLPQVRSSRIYIHTGDVVILHTGGCKAVLDAMADFRWTERDTEVVSVGKAHAVPVHDAKTVLSRSDGTGGRMGNSQAIQRRYLNKLVWKILFRLLRKLFFSSRMRMGYTVMRSVPFLYRGAVCVFRRRVRVEVLDALSIGVSIF
ncbi:MAG: hypothetical protein IJT94_01290, partial [Oscillibacter sp.]|nr:hypothetical protein [Oscillibacter sp.]